MDSDRPLSRRDALALLGLGAVAFALPGTAGAAPVRSPAAGRLTPFDLRDVRLLDGPFRDAQERNARYLLSLEPDRMLHNFRVNAGLAPKAPVYGGWESEEPWVAIRCHGHTLGHYLGAVAMTYAATGDAALQGSRGLHRRRAARLPAGARRRARVRVSRRRRSRSTTPIAGRPWNGVPWYTMHKIFAGLRDAHVHAASPGALPVLVGLAEWTWVATRDMSDEQMQRMLDTEHGGMTEVLADVSVLARRAEVPRARAPLRAPQGARAARRGARRARRAALEHADPEVRRLSSACTSSTGDAAARRRRAPLLAAP